MAGTLALVGAGEFLETMSKVDRLLLDRCGGNKVMILPTAAAPDGDGVPQKWIRLGVDHFNRLGAQAEGLLVLDRSHCDDDGFAAQVAEADLIYFSGGKPDYLHAALIGTRVWAAVQSVLSRGGVVAGCSAGAMIMGGYVPSFATRLSIPLITRWLPAFGLIPHAVVVPHYNEFPEIMINLMFGRRPASSYLIGVDAHTALIGLDGQWQAAGAGRVTVRRGRNVKRYAAGQAVQLSHTSE